MGLERVRVAVVVLEAYDANTYNTGVCVIRTLVKLFGALARSISCRKSRHIACSPIG